MIRENGYYWIETTYPFSSDKWVTVAYLEDGEWFVVGIDYSWMMDSDSRVVLSDRLPEPNIKK